MSIHTRGLLTPLPIALCPALSGCAGVLAPAGPVGVAQRQILLNSVAIMLAIVLPIIVLTLWFAWRYRATNPRARYLPEWCYSGRLELLVWSVPALVVMFLGGIGWISSHDLDPAAALPGKGKPVEVQVVSLDWKWLFIYPELGIASVNRLVLPSGVPVHFRLTSATVMNSFFVPRLGSQIYAMAGMATQLHLQASQPGRYAGLSAQFSGDGFSDMHFDVDAMPQADYDSWASQVRNQGPALDAAAYAALAKPGIAAPGTYRAVAANLFDDIVTMRCAPAAGEAGLPAPARIANPPNSAKPRDANVCSAS